MPLATAQPQPRSLLLLSGRPFVLPITLLDFTSIQSNPLLRSSSGPTDTHTDRHTRKHRRTSTHAQRHTCVCLDESIFLATKRARLLLCMGAKHGRPTEIEPAPSREASSLRPFPGELHTIPIECECLLINWPAGHLLSLAWPTNLLLPHSPACPASPHGPPTMRPNDAAGPPPHERFLIDMIAFPGHLVAWAAARYVGAAGNGGPLFLRWNLGGQIWVGAESRVRAARTEPSGRAGCVSPQFARCTPRTLCGLIESCARRGLGCPTRDEQLQQTLPRAHTLWVPFVASRLDAPELAK